MKGTDYLTKKDAVIERLRSEIYSGSLVAGTALQQNDVAARLSVSPTPVREAFHALQAEGLIVIRAHYGAVVAEQDFANMAAVYELRIPVELNALRRALRLPREEFADGLLANVNRSRRALAAADLSAFRTANLDFHRLVARGANSRIYTELGQLLISRSTPFAPLTRVRMRQVQAQHTAIAAALRDGDGDEAIEQLETHLRTNWRLLTRKGPAAAARRLA